MFLGFSTGANLSSAFVDVTAGGECLNDLKLAVHVRGNPISKTTQSYVSYGRFIFFISDN